MIHKFLLNQLEFSTPKKPGQVIQTSTQITAHHKGFVEFKLCPRNDETMTGDELQVFYVQQLRLILNIFVMKIRGIDSLGDFIHFIARLLIYLERYRVTLLGMLGCKCSKCTYRGYQVSFGRYT